MDQAAEILAKVAVAKSIGNSLAVGASEAARRTKGTHSHHHRAAPGKGKMEQFFCSLRRGKAGMNAVYRNLGAFQLSVDLVGLGGGADVEARNIGGNLFNFFRYDYREFTEPTYTDVTVDVKLVSLLFDAASNERVHSVEVSTTEGETAYHVITSQSEAIVDRMKKDELIP
jgi:hypothetical protein